MNFAHYVSNFQLKATERSLMSGHDLLRTRENCRQEKLATTEVFHQWKLPEKIDLIENLDFQPNQLQVTNIQQKKIFESKTMILCVGGQQPAITALLYCILTVMKKSQIHKINKDIMAEKTQTKGEQYEQNYLQFKHKIYRLAQIHLSNPEISLLVENIANLYYSTDIIGYLQKNQQFIRYFSILFKGFNSSIQKEDIDKKSVQIVDIAGFLENFSFLTSKIYQSDVCLQYFKQESLDKKYDIIEVVLKGFPGTYPRIYIVREVQCYFIVEISAEAKSKEKTPLKHQKFTKLHDSTSHKKHPISINGEYSTPKFILSRSNKTEKQEISVKKFDDQANPFRYEEGETRILRENKEQKAPTKNKEEQSTETNSWTRFPVASSKTSDHQVKISPIFSKKLGSISNLSQIPEQFPSLNRNIFQNIKMQSSKKLAELLQNKKRPKLPSFIKNCDSGSIKRKGNPQKNQNFLRNLKQQIQNRKGALYESLKVTSSEKLHSQKKIRQTLNFRIPEKRIIRNYLGSERSVGSDNRTEDVKYFNTGSFRSLDLKNVEISPQKINYPKNQFNTLKCKTENTICHPHQIIYHNLNSSGVFPKNPEIMSPRAIHTISPFPQNQKIPTQIPQNHPKCSYLLKINTHSKHNRSISPPYHFPLPNRFPFTKNQRQSVKIF